MASSIVDKLPDISSSLIGLLGALYAVYAAYGYQKIWETHNKKKRFERIVEVFRKEGGALETLEEYRHNLFTPDYWNNVIIRNFAKATHIGDHASRGGNIYEFYYEPSRKVTDDALGSVFRSFTGSLDFALDALNNKPITKDSLQTFRLRIADIKKITDGFSRSLSMLAQLADGPKNNEGSDFRNRFHVLVMEQFILRVNKCSNEIIPELRSAIDELSVYENAFQLRKTTLWSIIALAWILIFGVFLPPTILSIAKDLEFLIPSWCKYVLLMVNILPYAYIAMWTWQKVFKLPYN